jgi:hypothetical protein
MLNAAVPSMLALEPARMIDAPLPSSGNAVWTVKITPFTLSPKISSTCASVIAPSGSIDPPPALA